MKSKLALILVALSSSIAVAQQAVPVTADNFVRAETDMYMGRFAKEGAFAKFIHSRTPAEID